MTDSTIQAALALLRHGESFAITPKASGADRFRWVVDIQNQRDLDPNRPWPIWTGNDLDECLSAALQWLQQREGTPPSQ